jgi:hypothetical protein
MISQFSMVRRITHVSAISALALGGALALWQVRPALATPVEVNQLDTNKTISGTVVSADGKPAANIQVKLVAASPKGAGPARRDPNGSPTGDSNVGNPQANPLQKAPGSLDKGEHVVQASTTDGSGKFSFSSVPPGAYSVIAGMGNKAARETVSFKANEDPAPLTLKLPK